MHVGRGVSPMLGQAGGRGEKKRRGEGEGWMGLGFRGRWFLRLEVGPELGVLQAGTVGLRAGGVEGAGSLFGEGGGGTGARQEDWLRA